MKLEGVRVLDLSMFLPGPHLTMMMADHGAEVVRIEPPGGEPVREVGLKQAGFSTWFRNTHRGKRCVRLDLKSEEGMAGFRALVARADVVVEAFRPGVAARLGIDYAACRAINPALVYCSISAYGQTGPKVDRPAHDLAMQADSGVVSLNLGQDGEPATDDHAGAVTAGIVGVEPEREQAAGLRVGVDVVTGFQVAVATGAGDPVQREAVHPDRGRHHDVDLATVDDVRVRRRRATAIIARLEIAAEDGIRARRLTGDLDLDRGGVVGTERIGIGSGNFGADRYRAGFQGHHIGDHLQGAGLGAVGDIARMRAADVDAGGAAGPASGTAAGVGAWRRPRNFLRV